MKVDNILELLKSTLHELDKGDPYTVASSVVFDVNRVELIRSNLNTMALELEQVNEENSNLS